MSPTTLYPASSYTSLGATKGCDQEHIRPADPHTGKPVRRWAVECAAHEAFYMGHDRPRVLKYITDPKTGQAANQQRVPDAHPGFSTNPDAVPLTHDEERTHHIRLEQGENQLRALEALITLKAGGLDYTSRPEVMLYLQENGLPPEMLVPGAMVCANGHDAPAGSKFCPECSISMAAKAAIGSGRDDGDAPIDLGRLHVQSLKKLCRDRDLPDDGSKDELISRLEAA